MKRRQPPPPALPLEVLDILIDGHTRCPADVEALHAAGRAYDAWVEFDNLDWAGLWHAHRGAVLEEAARRGIARPWGQSFDGQTETRAVLLVR